MTFSKLSKKIIFKCFSISQSLINVCAESNSALTFFQFMESNQILLLGKCWEKIRRSLRIGIYWKEPFAPLQCDSLIWGSKLDHSLCHVIESGCELIVPILHTLISGELIENREIRCFSKHLSSKHHLFVSHFVNEFSHCNCVFGRSLGVNKPHPFDYLEFARVKSIHGQMFEDGFLFSRIENLHPRRMNLHNIPFLRASNVSLKLCMIMSKWLFFQFAPHLNRLRVSF